MPPPAKGATARRAALRELAIAQLAAGAPIDVVAEALEVTPGTVRRWRRSEPRRPGRPPRPVSRERCARILRELRASKGSTTVAQLKQRYPEVPRSVLEKMLRDWRRGARSRQRRRRQRLQWTKPATVWAMDFTALGHKGDPVALCIRDLGSKAVLFAGICGEGAADVLAVLEALFARDGRPLLIKSDNGPGFRAAELKLFVERHGVLMLYSPPGCPRYNGACEAGMTGLKRLAQGCADDRGRPLPGDDDLAEAVRILNDRLLFESVASPTRAEVWQRRSSCEGIRDAFRANVERRRQAERERRGIALGDGVSHNRGASIDRVAIPEALCDMQLLVIRRP